MKPWLLPLALALTVAALAADPDPDAAPATAAKTKPLLVVPKDRVLVQRGFVPYGGEKKFYACAVGSPAGTHYAYDCETGAILSAWRGDFIDVAEMWDGRAFNQTAVPAGKAMLTLNDKPALAQFPDRLLDYPNTWPERADPLYSSQGYELDADGSPTFLATLADLTVRDQIAVATDGHGLTRTIVCGGKLSLWETWVLLAEGDTITARPGGFDIGPNGWHLDWPADSKHRPVVRPAPDHRQQLVLHLTKATFTQPIAYAVRWGTTP